MSEMKHTPGPWFAFITDDLRAVGTGKSGKAIDKIVHWSGFDACGVTLQLKEATRHDARRHLESHPAMTTG